MLLTDAEIRRHVVTDPDGLEWVPAPLAALMVPSPRTGKNTHVNTLKRLWQEGKLDAAKHPHRGNVRYYRLDQIRAMGRVERVGPPGTVKGVAAAPLTNTAATLARMVRDMAPTRAAKQGA